MSDSGETLTRTDASPEESAAGMEEADRHSDETESVNIQQVVQLEEAKLKAKYPAALRPGGTAFLQKRLNKGQKYFDSGDYNMAKAKGQKRSVPVVPQPTGEAIPTPDNLPTRKTSLVQSKLAAGLT